MSESKYKKRKYTIKKKQRGLLSGGGDGAPPPTKPRPWNWLLRLLCPYI